MNLSRQRFETLHAAKSKMESRLKKDVSWDDFFGYLVEAGKIR